MSSHSKQFFAWAALATAGFLTSLAPAAHAQNQLWVHQFGTSESDGAGALAPDGAGGMMVAGLTTGG